MPSGVSVLPTTVQFESSTGPLAYMVGIINNVANRCIKAPMSIRQSTRSSPPAPRGGGGPSGVYGCAGQVVGNAFAPHGIVIILDLGAVGCQG